MSYQKLTDVTLTNGSKQVTVSSSEPLEGFINGDTLQVKGELPVLIESIDLNTRVVTLREPWDEADQANVKVVLESTVLDIKETGENVKALVGQSTQAIRQMDNLANTVTTVTLTLPDGETATIPSLPKAIQDATNAGTQLMQNAQTAIELMGDAPSLAQQVTDDKAIVFAYKTTVEADKTAALEHRNKAEEFKNEAQQVLEAVRLVFDNFDDIYLGPHDNDPTQDNDGDPLKIGMLYYNRTAKLLKFYDGTQWDGPSQTATQAAAAALGYKNDANNVLTQVTALRAECERLRDEQQQIAGGTAPNSLKLGGKAPDEYLQKDEIAFSQKAKNKALVQGDSPGWRYPTAVTRTETSNFELEAGDFAFVKATSDIVEVSFPALSGGEPFKLKLSATSTHLLKILKPGITLIGENGQEVTSENNLTLSPGESIEIHIDPDDPTKAEVL